jgi:hypothetical protein
MSVNVKPVEQLEFRGVYTAGNPIQRPRNTAERCQNFRIMPGGWLRLRGGRTPRYNATGIVRQLHPFRLVDYAGSDYQLAQVDFGTEQSPDVQWHWFHLATYVIVAPPYQGYTNVEDIATAHDSAFAKSNPAAVANLNDRPVMYNGLGVRDVSNSRPPFSHYHGGVIRYFGLDAYCPVSLPTVSFAAGAGNNEVLTAVKLYVGLYHEPTEHYSNGVYAGEITTTGGKGTITAENLSRLTYAYHNVTEQSELYYVFYATIDSGEVPYLILNSSLNGPHKVAVTSSSLSLSVASGTTNGWVLDLTKEMPTENFPPRPMRSIAYVNGRLYGALMSGGSGSHADFKYTPDSRDMAAVCWSAAAGDSVDRDFLGDPLQSWPLLNLAYTPSGDQPVIVAPADEGTLALVITPSSAFYLEEQADGLHDWTAISRVHGIKSPASLRVTDHGIVWVTQRNQIVLLRPGSRRLEILSTEYQSLLVGSVRCADYILDPVNLIDRYQVWFDTGASVCHDFGVGGQAYSATNQDFTAASTAVDSAGRRHHIVAKDGLYTHEAQPETGLISTTDATFDASEQTYSAVEIDGEYIRNWDDFGDSDVRKEMPMVDVIGDGESSAALGASPITVEWYADFEQVTGANKRTATGARITQSTTVSTYRHKLANSHKFWFKLVFKLRGHSADGPTATYPALATEGSLASNFYGSILRLLWRLGVSENRS